MTPRDQYGDQAFESNCSLFLSKDLMMMMMKKMAIADNDRLLEMSIVYDNIFLWLLHTRF